jgi:hypothetical protein
LALPNVLFSIENFMCLESSHFPSHTEVCTIVFYCNSLVCIHSSIFKCNYQVHFHPKYVLLFLLLKNPLVLEFVNSGHCWVLLILCEFAILNYLGSFNTNYIIFHNVGIFLKNQTKKILKENTESSKTFYMLKWIFFN